LALLTMLAVGRAIERLAGDEALSHVKAVDGFAGARLSANAQHTADGKEIRDNPAVELLFVVEYLLPRQNLKLSHYESIAEADKKANNFSTKIVYFSA
jgi:hypothetical protein